MPPELSSAIVGAVIAAVVAMGAAAALLPPFIKRQMNIHQTSQEDRIAIEKKKSEDALEEAHQERLAAEVQRNQFSRLVDSLITEREAQTKQQEVMVRALTGSVSVLDSMSKELRANTQITGEIPKELGALTERFDVLLDTGSKPLQELKIDVKELAKGLSAVTASQRDTTEKINFIHEKILEIVTMRGTLDVLQKLAEAKLDDVRKSTEENNKVNLVITPTTP